MQNRVFLIASISAIMASSLPALSDVDVGVLALEEGNSEAAAAAFQDAFDNGDADGAFYLGRMIELGFGTEPNLEQAVELYKVATKLESALAMNRLGLMYLDGQVVIRDFARGSELVCGAADKGEPNAQFNCGATYSQGRGVVQDQAKAFEYWQLAADQDHIAATNFVALGYKSGDGLDADPARAFAMFTKTANEGNPLGLFELALAYQSGQGTELDMTKAYTFANLAAARGHPDGPTLRDQIEAELSSEQITRAQTEAREWVAAAETRAIEE